MSVPRPRPAVSIAILAGGLSTRMGKDKARLRVGLRTMLGHARRNAQELGLPVRVIRRDRVRRCGPLGGILTALETSQAETELFLACDMPFLTSDLMRTLLRRLGPKRTAVFLEIDGVVGFPFALRANCLPLVKQQVQKKIFSLQALAVELGALRVPVPRTRLNDIFNVNAPRDLKAARSRQREGIATRA